LLSKGCRANREAREIENPIDEEQNSLRCKNSLEMPALVHEPVIRGIVPSDAEAAARLSGELGYPVSPEAMTQRILQISEQPDHAVYVASLDSKVVGWIELAITSHLTSEPYAEIGGLVVTESARSHGIGGRLVRFAEEWAKKQGVQKILVRSRVTRERAHLFYERAGFGRVKTSAVFEKAI
jgi:GNAT superfamily N-acetyltransferase